MQESVLRTVTSEQFAAYAVWEPILRTDTEPTSLKATTLFSDSRVAQYWVSTTAVGEVFQSPINLTTEPAWDVYLLYPSGVTWDGAGPPRPVFFMHQLGGRLPEEARLDGPKLAERVRLLLSRQ